MACCWFGSWRLVVCQSVSFGQRGVCTENRAYFSASWSRLASAGKKNPSRPSISSFHFLPSPSHLGNFARGSIPQTPCSRIPRSKTMEYHPSVEWTVLGNFAEKFSKFQEFETFERFESGAVSQISRSQISRVVCI